MAATWKQADVFPIIVQVIRDLHAKEPRYITHDEITGFVEVEAKQAARECGAEEGANTRQMWESIWKQ